MHPTDPLPDPRRHRSFWPWAGLWLLISLPLLVYLALFGGASAASTAAILGLVGQSVLVVLVGALRLKPSLLVRGLLITLVLLLSAGVLEQRLSKHVWLSSDKAGVLESVAQLVQGRVSQVGFRSWSARSEDRATLHFETRLGGGRPGWDWFRSGGPWQLEPLGGEGEQFTRAHVPQGGAPSLMRTFDVGEAIGGKIFRVLLELRDPDAPPAAEGVPRPEIEPGSPVGAQRCFGVALLAWSPGGGGRCLPVTLDGTWQRYSLSWRVPDGVESSVIRVVLTGPGDSTLDVRQVKLYVGRRGLGPLMPQAASIQVAWAARPERHSGYAFVPTEAWEAHALELERGDTRDAGLNSLPTSGDTLTATLQTATDLSLETRRVRVTGQDGAALPPVVSSARQTLFFGDPNLAGHTVAALGLALLALAPPLPALGGALLTLAGVALTGSRAAWLGVMFGVPWLLWLALPRRRRFVSVSLLGAGGLFIVGVLGVYGGSVRGFQGAAGFLQGPLSRLFSAYEVTARTDIWRAAWEAFLLHPWRGLGAGGFAGYWFDTRGGEAVQHAHNLWLELTASYGLFGLSSALLLSTGLPYLAWRWGGARGVALVAAVLVMNVFDTTFFYAGVLFPLALALNALRRRAPEWHLDSSQPTPRATSQSQIHAQVQTQTQTKSSAAPLVIRRRG